MNIYFVKNIRVYIFIYRNSIRIRTLQVHINGILDILCVRIIVRLNDIQHSNNRLSLSQTKGRKEEDTCDERWKCPRNTYFFFFFFHFLSILLDIQSREVNLPESIADKSGREVGRG